MTILKGDYAIEIDFDKNSENPSRIFQAMSNIISAFQQFDHDLISPISSSIEPVILLEDVEVGSLKTWLLNQLRGIPDEALKKSDWKSVLGHYLVKSKYILIDKLQGQTLITDAKIIQEIQKEIQSEAEKTDVKFFPNYSPISIPKLLRNIDNINKSMQVLNIEKDKAKLTTEFGQTPFNLRLNFTPEEMEDLMTKEKIETDGIMILKVKKPDYIGASMWDFKYAGHVISAKILHDQWLNDFQNRKYDIRPGDSIRVKMKTIVKYGYDNDVVGSTYNIIEVIEILPFTESDQSFLDLI